MSHRTEIFHLLSEADGTALEGTIVYPDQAPKGIVQISHGMAEYRGRYLPFLEFLADAGYLGVIHDHRGHGSSAASPRELGYFGKAGWRGAVADLSLVTSYLQNRNPGLPVYLFAHSMGTMIARIFLKDHDAQIQKLVLCGPPTQNRMAGLGIFLTRLLTAFCGAHHRSAFLQLLSFAGYAKKGESKTAWICSNPETVRAYDAHPLCGFTFTLNGFEALFSLMQQCFSKKGWHMRHKDLPILLMAGSDDPVIQSEAAFASAARFLQQRGYQDVSQKLYPGLRHELLNERGNRAIYEDILSFIES